MAGVEPVQAEGSGEKDERVDVSRREYPEVRAIEGREPGFIQALGDGQDCRVDSVGPRLDVLEQGDKHARMQTCVNPVATSTSTGAGITNVS